MDVTEVLKFKPETPGHAGSGTKSIPESSRTAAFLGKRQPIPSISGLSDGVPKKRRIEVPDDEPESKPSVNEVLEALEKDDFEGTKGEVDDTAVKKMILQLEKRTLKNQEMRIKYSDQPERFMESEVELHDTLNEMQVIATTPDFYPILVSLRSVECLLQLLSHDNTDISLAVVDLIQEMTEPDAVQEAPDSTAPFLNALLEGQLVPLLVQNLARLDESVKEEADGVHNTLGIMENLCEFRPEICNDIAKQGIMAWLLKRLQKRTFDLNKLYISEILAILLQYDEANRELLGELEGIDLLLQQLAAYKRHDPQSRDEIEMMENLFNCLCSALLLKTNRDKFLKGEGLQLMNLMLREKKMSRNSAIKVLSFSMSGEHGAENCTKFVDILGLRTIFPLLMVTPKRNKVQSGTAQVDLEEHILTVVASLLRHCTGQQRTRVLSKFTENDHEKVDRLVELHFKYFELVKETDVRIQRERQDPSLWTSTSTEELEEEIYLRRLEGGLSCLQLVDLIMMEVCVHGASSVKSRVVQLLRMRSASPKVILRIVEESVDNIGDSKTRAETKEHNRLMDLMKRFEADL